MKKSYNRLTRYYLTPVCALLAASSAYATDGYFHMAMV